MTPEEAGASTVPPDVIVRGSAPEPCWDATLGIPVASRRASEQPRHRLVVIGDSVCHGFQSGAITNTDFSFPAIVAHELGWYHEFRRPHYYAFGGLPFNIEYFARYLERQFPAGIHWHNAGPAAVSAVRYMLAAKSWWERGPGARVDADEHHIMHNLAVSGWDVRDVLEYDADMLRAIISGKRDTITPPLLPSHSIERAALRVLDSARVNGRALTIPQAAKRLGDDGGIETLLVFIGNNNVLRTMSDLKLVWSRDDDYTDLEKKYAYTIWRPEHFRKELRLLADAVAKIDARHVIWCTIPHVTELPIAHGVGGKMHPGSRYFNYYTRPWYSGSGFDPSRHQYVTGDEARIVDSVVDQYDEAIFDIVREARGAHMDWLLCDVRGMVDRFAMRYINDVAARPKWWRPLRLPPVLQAMQPKLDGQFFASGPRGRIAGGFVSLDGIHPTTTFYGLLAQYVLEVMRRAGVPFVGRERDRIFIDFDRLLARDSLLSDPPRMLQADIELLGWIEERLGVLRHVLRFG